MMNRRHLLKTFGAVGASGALPSAFALTPAEVKARGRLSFALYNDFPPFHDAGKGIEVELAQLIAKELGATASFLPFDASDENMEDDLRNMVWRGHYLGYGPADVLMHVPVTSELMGAVRQVKIVAPYYTERLAIAHRLSAIPKVETLSDYGSKRVGAEMASISSYMIVSAEGGKFMGNVKHFKHPKQAVAAFKVGELDAVAGQRGELEGLLGKEAGVQISDAPYPRTMRSTWPVGMAVKSDRGELATALGAALDEIRKRGDLRAVFQSHGVSGSA